MPPYGMKFENHVVITRKIKLIKSLATQMCKFLLYAFKFIGIFYCEIVPGDRSIFMLRPNKQDVQH
jgi:hypothetical protein